MDTYFLWLFTVTKVCCVFGASQQKGIYLYFKSMQILTNDLVKSIFRLTILYTGNRYCELLEEHR